MARQRREPLLVSFSGIDGAGKSTQIDALQYRLEAGGLRTLRAEFWDDVAVFPKMREFLSLAVFRGDQGVGNPERPIRRRDKNVKSAFLTAARCFLYALDTFHLRSVVAQARRSCAAVVLFDRYIYDELANLPGNRALDFLLRFFLRLAPRPDLACLIDAEPEAAFRRKPEYPLEFLHANRAAYLRLSRTVKGMLVAGPGTPARVQEEILEAVKSKLRRSLPESAVAAAARPQGC
jgi:thymidylate kinase